MMNKQRRIALVLLLLMFVPTCSDFSKIVEPTFDPEFAVPLFRGEIVAGDLFRHADTMNYLRFTDDGRIIVTGEALLYEGPGEDFFSYRAALPEPFERAIGDFELPTFADSSVITLGEIADSIGGIAGAAIRAGNGTNQPFPPLQPQPLGSFPIGREGAIVTANLSGGRGILEVQNGLPVALTDIVLELRHNSTLLGTILIDTVSPGGTQQRDFPLAGLTFGRGLTLTCTSIGTPGSNTAVPIRTDDALRLFVFTDSMTASQGRAVIPEQNAFDEATSIALIGMQGERLRRATIAQGTLRLTIRSEVQTPAAITISSDSMTTADGTPFRRTANVPPATPTSPAEKNISIELAGMNIKALRRVDSTFLPLNFLVRLTAAGDTVDFDETERITADFDLSNIVFEEAIGYMGRRSFPDVNGQVIVGEVSDLDFAFRLTSPKLFIEAFNEFGIPAEARFDSLIFGYADGTSGRLSGSILDSVLRVEAAVGGIPAHNALRIDTLNSNIRELLSDAPRTISYYITAIANPNILTDTLNTYRRGAQLRVKLRTEIPLDFEGEASYTETIAFDGRSIESSVQEAELRLVAHNSFPLSLESLLFLRDGAGNLLDTLLYQGLPLVIGAAADGDTALSVFDFPFPPERMQTLRSTATIDVEVRLTTPDRAILRRDQSLRLQAGLRAIVNIP